MKSWRIAFLLCLVMAGCGAPSFKQSRQRAADYLGQAGAKYSAVTEALTSERQHQQFIRAPNDQIAMLISVGLGTSGAALQCADVRVILDNFDAREQLKEPHTTADYDKLEQAVDGLSKSAENLVTDPKLIEVTPATERLGLRDAQSLVKQAVELLANKRPT